MLHHIHHKVTQMPELILQDRIYFSETQKIPDAHFKNTLQYHFEELFAYHIFLLFLDSLRDLLRLPEFEKIKEYLLPEKARCEMI